MGGETRGAVTPSPRLRPGPARDGHLEHENPVRGTSASTPSPGEAPPAPPPAPSLPGVRGPLLLLELDVGARPRAGGSRKVVLLARATVIWPEVRGVNYLNYNLLIESLMTYLTHTNNNYK